MKARRAKIIERNGGICGRQVIRSAGVPEFSEETPRREAVDKQPAGPRSDRLFARPLTGVWHAEQSGIRKGTSFWP